MSGLIVFVVIVIVAIVFVIDHNKDAAEKERSLLRGNTSKTTARPEDVLTEEGIHRNKNNTMPTTDIIQQCHAAVWKIHDEFAPMSQVTDLEWFFKGLDKRIDNYRSQVIENFRTEPGLTADGIVLAQIVNSTFALIMTGQYCIYRGVLNMEGNALKRLHTYANRQMAMRGYMDQETAEDNQKYLDEQLRKIG